MFLAKPLRFRADLVCARSYAGKGAVLRSGAFLCPADPVRQVDSRIPVCDPAAGIAFPASTSARTRLASCPRKSRCVTLPCELLWRIPASESTLRSCHGSVDIVACSPVPAPVSQISLAQALDVRLTRGFVPRLTSMLRSIRGGGLSRPARRVQAGLGEGYEPACRLRLPRVCLHLAHPSMYGTTCLPAARSVASHRNNESSPCAGRRASFSHTQHRLHEEAVGFMRYESYGKAIGPPARRCRSVGKTLRICVPGRLPMAKCSRNAFPGGNPWQVLRSMHPKSGFGRENRQFVAAYCRRVFKMSWLWQDMRAMHPKSPANRLSGTHGVKILPGKGSFRCTGPSNHARRANLAIL